MHDQDDLFGTPEALAPKPEREKRPKAETTPERSTAPRKGSLQAALWSDELIALGKALPDTVRLGTSSWSYPGWEGMVWQNAPSEQTLAKKGLEIYAQHPLLRTVSIDRSFYRPLSASDFARYAAQVPAGFRFMVKAPSLLSDALVRSEDGRGKEPNAAFLSPELAVQEFIAPALEGLGQTLGALVFQLNPLPWHMLDRLPAVIEQLHTMLAALPALRPHAPDGVIAVEVRDPQWLAPDMLPLFADALRSAGATYCLGLHAKMPPLAEQLALLRRLWPGPLVCRWNLHPIHGPYGYAEAEKLYGPYDRIHHPEPALHAELARLIRTFSAHGQNAYVAISNHAEGCAPLSVQSLAREIVHPSPPEG
ncbi:DUF72 domain-containing protein [Diaphorobacter caeni]|uniref:DUF72 domain-containing protein n=1 Tax=Diaphorobacter caeni TaxID=2784387 RepID=UPI00188EB326|nr:DUF72 domain-containing protein [Diaphorobacter caeni]MBF5004553.1 DUF72 domain-containing protein [Diaphorobacter caeni]